MSTKESPVYREAPTDEDRMTLKGVADLGLPGGKRFPGGRGDRVRIVLEGVIDGVLYDDAGAASRRELKVKVDELVRVDRK